MKRETLYYNSIFSESTHRKSKVKTGYEFYILVPAENIFNRISPITHSLIYQNRK